jgi:hypothetical protein
VDFSRKGALGIFDVRSMCGFLEEGRSCPTLTLAKNQFNQRRALLPHIDIGEK